MKGRLLTAPACGLVGVQKLLERGALFIEVAFPTTWHLTPPFRRATGLLHSGLLMRKIGTATPPRSSVRRSHGS